MHNPISIPRFRRPSPATCLAGAALFLAVGGPAATVDAATAGTKFITGKQVKDSTITGKDIKDRSLTGKDVKDGTITKADLSKDIKLGGLPGTQTPGGQGETGQTGPAGPAGPAGADGATGPAGKDGAPGKDGATGPQGSQGDKGAKGDTGAQGPKGDTGAQGPKGDPGTPAPPEAFHVVGTSGQPVFAKDIGFGGYEFWHANDNNVNQVAFYKDAFGIVRLKGKAKCVGTTCNSASLIFQLPAGYRPAQNQVYVGLAGQNQNVAGTATRINVESSGWVSKAPTAMDSQNGWVTLDGITFRAEQ